MFLIMYNIEVGEKDLVSCTITPKKGSPVLVNRDHVKSIDFGQNTYEDWAGPTLRGDRTKNKDIYTYNCIFVTYTDGKIRSFYGESPDDIFAIRHLD